MSSSLVKNADLFTKMLEPSAFCTRQTVAAPQRGEVTCFTMVTMLREEDYLFPRWCVLPHCKRREDTSCSIKKCHQQTLLLLSCDYGVMLNLLFWCVRLRHASASSVALWYYWSSHTNQCNTSAVVCGGGGIIQSNIASLNLNHSNNNTAQHHNPQILKITCVKIENPYAGWTLRQKDVCVWIMDGSTPHTL